MYLVFRLDTRQFFHGFDEDGVPIWHESKAEVFRGKQATEDAMEISEHCRLVVIVAEPE